jgi:hypothetical protein
VRELGYLDGFGFHTGAKDFFSLPSSSFYFKLIARKVQPFFYFHFRSHCDIAPLALKKIGKEKKILCRCYPFQARIQCDGKLWPPVVLRLGMAWCL